MSPFITLLTAIKKLLAFKVDHDEFRDVIRDTKNDIEGIKNDIEDTKRDIEDVVKEFDANRTHWEEQGEEIALSEITVAIDEDGGYELLSEECPPLVEGDKYIVILNGVRYECIAMWDEEWEGVVLGNSAMFGGSLAGNDEPFYMDSYDDGEIYLNVETAGEYTVSILRKTTIVHPLDEKFLPEGVPYGSLTPVSQAEGTVVNANPCAYFKVADAIDFDIEKLNYVSLNAIFENSYSMTIESGVTVGVSEQYGGWRIYRTIGLNSEVIGAYLPDDESAFKWWNEIWGEGEAYTAGLYFRTYDEDLYGGQTFNCSYAFLIGGYKKIDKALLPNEIYDMIENAKGAADNAQVLADGKMDKNNPVGTGSFSMNRFAGTTVGTHSFAEGYRGTASGAYSHAEGYETTASGSCSHAEGDGTTASGNYSHAEGNLTVAAGDCLHVQGKYNQTEVYVLRDYRSLYIVGGKEYYASNEIRFDESTGVITLVNPVKWSISPPDKEIPYKYISTDTSSKSVLVYNSGYDAVWISGCLGGRNGAYDQVIREWESQTVAYEFDRYAHIVGNGTSNTARSNAHTLDWNGLGWFAGGLKVGGTGQDDANAKEVALKEDIPQGGVEQFRHIRTVVIPEDASTDTSGVNWLEREQGGYWFGFDTDENGEPFSLTEIFCVSVNATCSNPSWGSFDVAIGSPVPSYGYWGAGQFYLPVPVGKQGEVKTGLAYSVLFSNGNSVGWNAAFAGGIGKLESISKEISAGDSYTKIESMRTFINNGNAYGFLAGSTFKFYGR